MFDDFVRRTRKSSPLPTIVLIGLGVGAVMIIGVALLQWKDHKDDDRIDRLLTSMPTSHDDDLLGLVRSGGPDLADLTLATAPIRVELPGMSLETPGSLMVIGDYRTGNALNATWGVTWQVGTLPLAATVDNIVAAMAGADGAHATGSRAAELAGLPAREGEIQGTETTYVTVGQCGGRVITLVGRTDRTTYLGVRDSFICTPDASEDLGQGGIVVARRAGWRRVNGSVPILLTNRSGLVVTLSEFSSVGPLDEVIPPVAVASGIELDGDPTSEGDRRVWRGTYLDHPAAIVIWECPALNARGMAVVIAKRGKLADGLALALTGRCLEPGEDLPDYLAPVRSP